MKVRIKITGTAPMIMHNVRLADPADPLVHELRKLTSKRKKTPDDLTEIAKIEYVGGLYYDSDIGPYVPGEWIWACLYNGAKKNRHGPKIKEGLMISSELNPLVYQGPRGVDELWKDANYRFMRMVRVDRKRIPRCRPIFRGSWLTDAEGVIDPGIISLTDLQDIANVAGQQIGLGDWRPKYGRFTARVEET